MAGDGSGYSGTRVQVPRPHDRAPTGRWDRIRSIPRSHGPVNQMNETHRDPILNKAEGLTSKAGL